MSAPGCAAAQLRKRLLGWNAHEVLKWHRQSKGSNRRSAARVAALKTVDTARQPVSPKSPHGTLLNARPDPCHQFQLPEGLGFPFEGRATLFVTCEEKVFWMTNVSAPKIPLGEGQPFWHLSVAADGSLIIRHSEATVTRHTLSWARFARRP